tara:strand:+ start:1785 stop:2027 length:243 start_codon:yes stop_codon:yes gene_type:complete
MRKDLKSMATAMGKIKNPVSKKEEKLTTATGKPYERTANPTVDFAMQFGFTPTEKEVKKYARKGKYKKTARKAKKSSEKE